jgi:hypothetical protein
MGIHLLCCVHGNEHIETHDAIHDIFIIIVENDSLHGMRIITSTSFNHIQLLSLMNQHCAYQKWHLHFN